MNFVIRSFNALSTKELHDMYRLRSKVFVVEQNCVYQDVDGQDCLAFHVLAYDQQNLVAYARIFLPGVLMKKKAVIGRVVVDAGHRKKGVGHQLMRFCLKSISKNNTTPPIKISAQTHLQRFYEAHGFRGTSKEYLEDGIPHCEMIRL